jgi:4-aminobutyrate aminotransferase/(S)-3-amino-2-methylpropionate transaminase
VTGRADVMDSVHVGGLGGTYGGNPVAAAAALAVLDQIEREGLLERSRALGERIMERLRAMQSSHEVIGDVRGRAMMTAMELVSDRATKEPLESSIGTKIVQRCLENGVVILKAGTYDNVIRLLPPLTIEEGLLDEGLEILDEAIGSVVG